MNSYLTALAIARAIASASGLDSAYVYAHDTLVHADGSTEIPGSILYPAVFIRVRFEALASSSTIGRARIEIEMDAQGESSSADHAARENAVLATMDNIEALTDAFTALDSQQLIGKPCLIGSVRHPRDETFKLPYVYRAGVCAL